MFHENIVWILCVVHFFHLQEGTMFALPPTRPHPYFFNSIYVYLEYHTSHYPLMNLNDCFGPKHATKIPERMVFNTFALGFFFALAPTKLSK